MELPVLTVSGEASGRTVVVGDTLNMSPNDHVLWLDVRRTQGRRRQGTSKTKERGEVRGSTRKLYRQKGTGHARSGSAKSPVRRGGGHTFGPRPRQYGLRLSKKVRRLARLSALSYKVSQEKLRVVEGLEFESPSTHQLTNLIDRLDLTEAAVLVVTAAYASAVYRSSTNLARVQVKEVRNLSAEDILRHSVLLVEEDAVSALCSGPNSAAANS